MKIITFHLKIKHEQNFALMLRTLRFKTMSKIIKVRFGVHLSTELKLIIRI